MSKKKQAAEETAATENEDQVTEATETAESADESKALEEAQKAEVEKAKEAEKPKFPFQVAKGKSLVVKGKGNIHEGCEVRAEWLPGGDEKLAALVKAGVVEKTDAK